MPDLKMEPAQPSAGFVAAVEKTKAALREAGIGSFIFFAKDPDSDCEANIHEGTLVWRLGASELMKQDIVEMAKQAGKFGRF